MKRVKSSKMYKFIAKLDITMPGQSPQKRTEEHVFGVSNVKLNGLNFTQGFTKILFEKLEPKEWVDEFLLTGMRLQSRLEHYKKARFKVKYDQVIEEVTEFK